MGFADSVGKVTPLRPEIGTIIVNNFVGTSSTSSGMIYEIKEVSVVELKDMPRSEFL